MARKFPRGRVPLWPRRAAKKSREMARALIYVNPYTLWINGHLLEGQQPLQFISAVYACQVGGDQDWKVMVVRTVPNFGLAVVGMVPFIVHPEYEIRPPGPDPNPPKLGYSMLSPQWGHILEQQGITGEQALIVNDMLGRALRPPSTDLWGPISMSGLAGTGPQIPSLIIL
jgi:hypothetical protein